ncbi:LytR/AlgR family response regulator transcription factor [Spongiimicrobium salis]|uniref:LytR/AlgR family response regulator transcription factor n=1 Tax=Spongiimicrobium salis TaxID=1667022 RepID=UPI00374D62D1
MSTTQQKKYAIKKSSYTFLKNSTRHWIKKVIVLVIFSLVVNHIAASDNFLDSGSYRFPIVGFLFTIILAILVGIIANFNFNFYKEKYFSKKVEVKIIVRFIASTLAYISILYIPVNIFVGIIIDGELQLYFTLIGLLITLLICFIFIILLYSQGLYNLYKASLRDTEITIESGAKIKKLTYENIACFYSENKIVYTAKNDGTTITTDFTLNELEEKINDQLFFRANRKIIIHKDAIDLIEKIENGKLRVTLKTTLKNDTIAEINISRYKREAFIKWFSIKYF